MLKIRAKMRIESVGPGAYGQLLTLKGLAKKAADPGGASDEDDTNALFSPFSSVEIHICHPAFIGQFKPGQKFYLELTEVADNSTGPGKQGVLTKKGEASGG